MKLYYNLFFICIINIYTINAQTKQDSVIKLDEIILKSRKKTTKERSEFKKFAQSTEQLIDEEINRNNPLLLEQSLGSMAGVQVDKRTQFGGQRVVIRGYGNDEKFNNWGIKVYNNAFPLTSAEGITVLDDVDFSNLNSIDVIKGPASTLFGSGVGGVVRLYFKSNDYKGISLTQNTNFGSFGLFQTNSRMDYNTDNMSSFLSYSHLESNGYRPNGSSLKNMLTYNSIFKINNNESIEVFLSHNDSNEGVAGQISYSDYYQGIDNGNLAYLIKNAHTDFQSTRFAITNNANILSNFTNKTSIFYMNSIVDRIAAGAMENTSLQNFGVRSIFNLNNSINEKIKSNLQLGTEIQQCESLTSNFRFTGTNPLNSFEVSPISAGQYMKLSTNQSSYFVQERIDLNEYHLSLIVGLSANRISYSRKDLLALQGLIAGNTKNLSFDKKFDISFNPHLAIQKVYKNQIFNISYSEGYNAPTASKSYITAINKVNDNLLAEKAKMIEFSTQGLLFDTKFDYQISLFNINISNKLTTLSAPNPAGGNYNYTANTGNQVNKGLELSMGYLYQSKENSFITKIIPFINFSYFDFKYSDFKTILGGIYSDYSNKQVVGTPKEKYSIGCDIVLKSRVYLNTTYNYISNVFTDFANTNNVAGFGLVNAKLGYKFVSKNKKMELEIFEAGNNLTNQINYTFLFVGGNINDVDAGSVYPAGTVTDVNPGSKNAYFWTGINFKYKL